MDLYENDDVTIITWFPWSSFAQTQIQNGRWLMRTMRTTRTMRTCTTIVLLIKPFVWCRPRSRRRRGLLKLSNPSRKRSFSKPFFKAEEFEKASFFVFVWTRNILKTELFENDDVTIITWFPWSSLSQIQIQNRRWLLRFWILLVFCEWKTFVAFSESNLRFQISPL